MAIKIIPSSFECDCGNESHFGENTIRSMEKMSKRKRVTLGDDHNHSIVFYKEKAIEIICPTLGVCQIKSFR